MHESDHVYQNKKLTPLGILSFRYCDISSNTGMASYSNIAFVYFERRVDSKISPSAGQCCIVRSWSHPRAAKSIIQILGAAIEHKNTGMCTVVEAMKSFTKPRITPNPFELSRI